LPLDKSILAVFEVIDNVFIFPYILPVIVWEPVNTLLPVVAYEPVNNPIVSHLVLLDAVYELYPLLTVAWDAVYELKDAVVVRVAIVLLVLCVYALNEDVFNFVSMFACNTDDDWSNSPWVAYPPLKDDDKFNNSTNEAVADRLNYSVKHWIQ